MTSLHSSRGLYSFLCREVGAQVSAWPGDSELLDTAYDFGAMRNLYASHTGDDIFFYWFGIVSMDIQINSG